MRKNTSGERKKTLRERKERGMVRRRLVAFSVKVVRMVGSAGLDDIE